MGDLHIRIDEAVEAKAAEVLREMGLTLDQGVEILLNYVAQEQHLPFVPNAGTIEAMRAAQRGEVERFDSVEALIADALKDD